MPRPGSDSNLSSSGERVGGNANQGAASGSSNAGTRGGGTGGGYSGPKGFIGPSDEGRRIAGMPASPGGWTGDDKERDALRMGVSIAGTVLGALVGFPGGGLLGKAVPNRTPAERYADTHDYGGGSGGPGAVGPHGGGNSDNPLAQRLAQMAQAQAAAGASGTGGAQPPASTAPAPTPGTTPMLSPGAVPAATNPYTYGETGPEKSFFPQSSQILTDLAQRIQKLTAKDMTGVDKLDPLTGLPKKPTKPPATAPALSGLPRIVDLLR